MDTDTLVPPWASEISARLDTDMHDGLHSRLRAPVQSYIETRRAAASYADVFNSDILKIRNNSDEIVDGISNAELQLMFGDDGDARDLRLALRLFHYGCPAVYMDQGGYDLHSSEENP